SDETDSDEDSDEDDSDDKDSNESVEHSDSDSESITHQEENNMGNIFDKDAKDKLEGGELKHGLTNAKRKEITHSILDDMRRNGITLQDAYLKHAGTYGLDNIEVLFPDAKAGENTPQFLSRE